MTIQQFFLSSIMVSGLIFFSAFSPDQFIKSDQVNFDRGVMKKNSSAEKWIVRKCDDFDINGKGDNTAWEKTSWGMMTKLDPEGVAYTSRFKILYSAKGIYLLFAGEDNKITTKDYKDYEDIYEGDVFEVFFHPARDKPQYFEYEINPLGKELILTLVHGQGNNMAWAPWPHEYRNNRAVKKVVDVKGGKKEVNGLIMSWSAELFFPYSIFGLLPDNPPKSGTSWDANFCRIDYDSGHQVEWSWSKTITDNFHDLDKLGSILFE
jgi:Carbohydrate-binding family 9